MGFRMRFIVKVKFMHSALELSQLFINDKLVRIIVAENLVANHRILIIIILEFVVKIIIDYIPDINWGFSTEIDSDLH